MTLLLLLFGSRFLPSTLLPGTVLVGLLVIVVGFVDLDDGSESKATTDDDEALKEERGSPTTHDDAGNWLLGW